MALSIQEREKMVENDLATYFKLSVDDLLETHEHFAA